MAGAFAWLAAPLLKTHMWKRIVVLAAVQGLGARMLGMGRRDNMLMAGSKLEGSKVTLRNAGKRFAASLNNGGDVNVHAFITASERFVEDVERFGAFTERGVNDARKNLKRVKQASEGRVSSMRALLRIELQRGARRPEGGPTSSSGAEALLWSRLGISLWVELFKERLRARQGSLADHFRNGFQHSLARYFDRFGRAAFTMASRTAPDWDVVRQRTQLGCDGGVCSDEALTSELKTFVRDVEPVLARMTELQKSVGLEDLRTP
eukprot:997281-Prymnesium_polylepis.1